MAPGLRRKSFDGRFVSVLCAAHLEVPGTQKGTKIRRVYCKSTKLPEWWTNRPYASWYFADKKFVIVNGKFASYIQTVLDTKILRISLAKAFSQPALLHVWWFVKLVLALKDWILKRLQDLVRGDITVIGSHLAAQYVLLVWANEGVKQGLRSCRAFSSQLPVQNL